MSYIFGDEGSQHYKLLDYSIAPHKMPCAEKHDACVYSMDTDVDLRASHLTIADVEGDKDNCSKKRSSTRR